MKNIVTALFLMASLVSYGQQDTVYMDKDFDVVNAAEAYSYQIILHDQSDTNKVKVTEYLKAGPKVSEKNYLVYSVRVLDGKCTEWFENGQIKNTIEYKAGKLHGALLTYWDNGKPRRIDTYNNDKLINGKCLDPDGRELIHFVYRTLPTFPGGGKAYGKYLANKIRYPAAARKQKVEGTVVLVLIIDNDGTVSKVRVHKSVNNELSEEAIRVFKAMPKWTFGTEDGDPIRVSYIQPLTFRLN